MAEYIADRIIEKANGGDGLGMKHKNKIDEILISKGRGDLIVDLKD
ncbi:MAG: hypothetical protein E6920_20210 [Clostridium sp.]|nr:hypothetical protein [Clostridium sp.]